MISKDKRDELRRLHEAATPAPWAWRWPVGSRSGPDIVHPQCGMLLVMDARRFGMNGATVRFARRSPADRGGLMFDATQLMPDLTNSRPDFTNDRDLAALEPTIDQEPNNPDMHMMVAARNALPALLDALDAAEAERDSSGMSMAHMEANAKLYTQRLEIGDLKAKIDRLTAENKRYADRHWTCNGCGFSWNCDDAGVDNRGFKVCPIKCQACEVKRLREALARYGDHEHKCTWRPGTDRDPIGPPCSCGFDAELDWILHRQNEEATRE